MENSTMRGMPENVEINGQVYTRVPRARANEPDLVVYRGTDSFLRLGESTVIDRYMNVQRQMLDAKYPVADILSSGTHDQYAYYIEKSLGDRTFAQRFGDEFEKRGAVPSELFAEFLSSVRRYLQAQCAAPRAGKDIESFANAVHLPTIKEELPRAASKIQARFDKVIADLKHIPYVLSHGDFNPANLYEGGAIDIENAINAPLGYDAVTALETAAWFIKTDESALFSHYYFSDAQISEYKEMCADVYKSEIPIAFIWDDLAFCRAIWMTVRMHKWPQVQKFRYDKFMKTYLD